MAINYQYVVHGDILLCLILIPLNSQSLNMMFGICYLYASNITILNLNVQRAYSKDSEFIIQERYNMVGLCVSVLSVLFTNFH